MAETFVALGNSITYGFPFTPAVSWVEHIHRETGLKMINAGIPGDTLYDMRLRLKRDVLAFHPSLVSIMGGTNDFYAGMSQPQVQRDFLAILKELDRPGIKVLVGLPLPVADSTERTLRLWRAWLKEYCQQANLPLIDFYADFLDQAGRLKEDLLVDGLHPRRKGYEVMGKRAVQTLRELGVGLPLSQEAEEII